MRKLLLIFFISSLFLVAYKTGTFVYAEDSTTATEEDAEKIEDLEKKIEEYEKKIKNLQGQAQTLSREIETANTQIEITGLKIQNSINNIAKTEREIGELSGKLNDLSERIKLLVKRIEYQQDVLKERIRERYKTRETSPVMVLFGNSTLENLIKKAAYLRVMELQDKKVISEWRNTEKTYNRQKDLYQDRKEEQEALQTRLINEKANLDAYKRDLESQKAEKNKLLENTNNNEQKYQELLQKAKKELDSYSSFVANSGQGIIGPNGLGGGKGGWYYSQRDSRWAYDNIGNSNYTVYNSGCLVTSVAMIHKYYGYDIDPGDIADKDEYFFWGDMWIPWPGPKGRSYNLLSWSYSKSAIDKELSNDNPVIVGITANNSAGTHFVVLVDGKDGDYEMHDPIYGPNLNFSDYYSTSQIFEAVAFK